MTRTQMLEFIKDNFFVDGDGNLQYRYREDTPATAITKQQIEWLKTQNISHS
jgi:hypothetical protein